MYIKKDLSIRHRFIHFSFLIPLALVLYTLFLLVSNVGRGFDITDESFYILWSRNPGDVLASITQFGHYTGILYSLAGGNLAVFRLLGMLLLLVAAGCFSHALERFWRHLPGAPVPSSTRWISLSVILAGALAYYRYWLLTPSYNWLTLISILLVATGLLHAAVTAGDSTSCSYTISRLFRYGVLVGLGGGLSFMAKPTTAAILAIVFFYFIVVTSLRGRWKVFAASSVISSIAFIVIHALVFEKGLGPFYAELRGGVELGKLLDGGHTITLISVQAVQDLLEIPGRMVHNVGLSFLFLVGSCALIRYRQYRNKEIAKIFTILLTIISIVAWFQLWKAGYWVGGQGVGTRIGFGGLAFSFAILLSGLSTLVLWKKRERYKSCNVIQFRELLKLYTLLLLLAMAYAFGSGDGLIRQMSGGFVFLSAASLYTAYWIDQYIGGRYLLYVVSFLLVLSVCLIMTSAYGNPYRLPAKVKNQMVPITFVGDNGTIYVDEDTAEYVRDLKRNALAAGWKPGISFIDLTGASPGAAVIIGGKVVGTPWLLGGYKGSDAFAHVALAEVSTSTLRTAWVLTAHKGRRKLSYTVLSDLGLEFPNTYEAVGKVRTGYRHEEQVLWRPLNSIISEK